MSRIMLIALCSIVEGQSGINCAKTFQPIEKTVRVRLKVMRIMQRAYAPSFLRKAVTHIKHKIFRVMQVRKSIWMMGYISQ